MRFMIRLVLMMKDMMRREMVILMMTGVMMKMEGTTRDVLLLN